MIGRLNKEEKLIVRKRSKNINKHGQKEVRERMEAKKVRLEEMRPEEVKPEEVRPKKSKTINQ